MSSSHFTPAIIAQDKAFVASVRPVKNIAKDLALKDPEILRSKESAEDVFDWWNDT